MQKFIDESYFEGIYYDSRFFLFIVFFFKCIKKEDIFFVYLIVDNILFIKN